MYAPRLFYKIDSMKISFALLLKKAYFKTITTLYFLFTNRNRYFRGFLAMENNKNSHDHHHHHDHSAHDHEHGMWDELIHHIPYAIFSVAFCLAILSFTSIASSAQASDVCKQAHRLFHSFHFMHIVFAATGTLITFFRFSNNWLLGLLVGIMNPIIFCTLSDSVLPYFGGLALR